MSETNLPPRRRLLGRGVILDTKNRRLELCLAEIRLSLPECFAGADDFTTVRMLKDSLEAWNADFAETCFMDRERYARITAKLAPQLDIVVPLAGRRPQ